MTREDGVLWRERARQTDRQRGRQRGSGTWFDTASDVSKHVGCVTPFIIRWNMQLHSPVVDHTVP